MDIAALIINPGCPREKTLGCDPFRGQYALRPGEQPDPVDDLFLGDESLGFEDDEPDRDFAGLVIGLADHGGRR